MTNLREVFNDANIGEVSDGYHTFNELYHTRAILNAALFNAHPNICWKSKKHYNEENDPMYDGYFIVGMDTPYGQATWHYELKYWDLFNVQELNRARQFDLHTNEEALERIQKFLC